MRLLLRKAERRIVALVVVVAIHGLKLVVGVVLEHPGVILGVASLDGMRHLNILERVLFFGAVRAGLKPLRLIFFGRTFGTLRRKVLILEDFIVLTLLLGYRLAILAHILTKHLPIWLQQRWADLRW